MALSKYKLGELIEQRREKYNCLDELPVRGVSRNGFILAKQPDADKSMYNVFYKYDFVFNPARMELNSIALNTEFDKAICSSLYEIFYIKNKEIILPEYLNMFVKRQEFARQCEYIGWGSAREYCRVSSISDIDILLPPIEVQQKYMDIYQGMVNNQKAYECGLEDLKLVCDGYIEDLRRRFPSEPIGKYLSLSDRRNDIGLGLDAVRGISIDKKFIFTKADMDGVGLNNYKAVLPNYFAFVPVTSRNGEKISLAYNDEIYTYIVSSSYIVFCISDENLYAPYLNIILNRQEFNRYARFNSWGSAREVFNFDDMCNVKIPIPAIDVQKSIANIFKVYNTRKRINEQLKAQIKDICPILIKGSIDEAR